MSNRPEARHKEVDDADDKFKDMDEFLDPLADVEAPANAAAAGVGCAAADADGYIAKSKEAID